MIEHLKETIVQIERKLHKDHMCAVMVSENLKKALSSTDRAECMKYISFALLDIQMILEERNNENSN